jgi:2-haloacid dehalogenase
MRLFRRKPEVNADPSPVPAAIVFDLFGTTVDWLGGMIRRGEVLGAKRGIHADWAGLAKEWRSRYKPAIRAVREKRRRWADFDTLHREQLDKIVGWYGLKKLSSADRDWLTEGWHCLDPWPDVRPALHRLKKRFIVGPLSNAHLRQEVDLARWGELPWDVLLGADMFRTYKPAREIYKGAAAYLHLKPEQMLLVAAHNEDLEHAKKHGMKTCFVHRSTEDAAPTGKFDHVVEDFEQLTRTLGAV